MAPTTIILICSTALVTNLLIVGLSLWAHKKIFKSMDNSLNAIEDNAKQWDAMAEKHGFKWR